MSYYQPPQNRDFKKPFDGMAIASFVLAFIPGLITYGLSLGFGIASFRRTKNGETRGAGLAVAGLIIGPAVGFLVIYAAVMLPLLAGESTAASPGHDATAVSAEKYAQSADDDVINTANEIKSALRANPGLNIETVPQIKHGDTIMEIRQEGSQWAVLAGSTKLGDPAKDYVIYDSTSDIYTVHGGFAEYETYIRTHYPSVTQQYQR
jgi:hypothetical protein